jgi:hypothetical protein
VFAIGTVVMPGDAAWLPGDGSPDGFAWLDAAVLSVGNGEPLAGGELDSVVLLGLGDGDGEVGPGELDGDDDGDVVGDGLIGVVGGAEPALQLGDTFDDPLPLWLTGPPLP